MKQLPKTQTIPLLLTLVTFCCLIFLMWGFIHFLNFLPTHEKITLHIYFPDILIGMTIYLKTAIDFAIFIGNLMRNNTGIKSRIAIEVGTALGNGIGTGLILLVWVFFKEIPLLLFCMIILASLVLLQMAEESFEELVLGKKMIQRQIPNVLSFLQGVLHRINHLSHHLLRFILPKEKALITPTLPVTKLLFFSMRIPFILGLDDFAGYIPLFSIVNVFGFTIGVFFGHMLLNLLLFVSPTHTTRIVRSSFILLLGGLAFVGIAVWGLFEAAHLLLTHLR